MDASPVFEMKDLSVSYGSRRAVEGLNLSQYVGESLGLLGVNGAGKTSTIRALLGMLKPKRGSITLFGDAPGHPRTFQKIGFAPEDGLPPEYLSGQEYLSFIGGLRVRDAHARATEIKELLEWFELAPQKKIRDYSKGMKRRLLLAQAFVGNPSLLILDEPLNGLDPLIIIKLRQRLDDYRKGGGTVLFSSHILTEVEKSCSAVAILSQGKLVYSTKIEDLLKEFSSVEAAFAAKVGKS